jgi:L-alanine-DL-glutamate epimerase-like enolase superfamily enzyme
VEANPAALSASLAKARIRKIETIPLRIPFAAPFTIAAPHEPKREHIDVLIVRVFTDLGLYGIGETQAWRRQGSSEVIQNLAGLINEIFTPLLMGRSPLAIASILHDLNAAVYNSLYAQAAIGDALYDLAGKLFNVPVYELIGGKCRDSIRVGIPLSITSSDLLLEKTQKMVELGYRHIRVKIGMDPEADFAHIKLLRDHFGDGITLRADANGGMHFEQALLLLKKIEDFGLDIVEQPVPMWDLEGLAALSRSVRIPISADESLTTDHSLVEIIKKRAASIIQTKVGKNGGLYYTRKLWTVADAAEIGIFPGNHPCTSIAASSVTHLCASWPELRIVGDFQAGPCDMLSSDIVKNPLVVENGYVKVPEGPGLGMELDDYKVGQFRLKT